MHDSTAHCTHCLQPLNVVQTDVNDPISILQPHSIMLPENGEQVAKFLVISSSNEGDALSKLSPFIIEKFLKAGVRTLDNIKRLRGGQLLIETNSQTYSKKILELSDLAGVPVNAMPHRTLM